MQFRRTSRHSNPSGQQPTAARLVDNADNADEVNEAVPSNLNERNNVDPNANDETNVRNEDSL